MTSVERVYVVTAWAYDSNDVIAVAQTREDAEAFARAFVAKEHKRRRSSGVMQIWEIIPNVPDGFQAVHELEKNVGRAK